MRVHTLWRAAILSLIALAFSPAQAEEVKLEHDGLTLNAELELAPGSELADGVILMTHGTLAHARMGIMRGLQNVFREYGYNTLAINLGLGIDDRHGMYDCAQTHTHRHTDALDEIGLWLDWLREQGAGRVTLLGHSRGGNQTAWYAAERDMSDVNAVVLIAPMLWDEEYDRKEYKDRYEVELQPLLDRARGLVEDGKSGTLMESVDFLYCENTTVSAGAFLSYYAPDPRRDTAHLVPEIEAPVLVIAGTADTVVPGVEEAMAPVAEADGISLTVIEGADHMFRDLYWYDVAEAVEGFLSAQE
ncbi:alpha/beta hydrolase fold protein [Thiohalobacter thiocyanaticus]|uniref:Alpha/beta hydrolase fold protein n=1 Tax=Thiohalobacter thiocyanaticus TaxID=585455 RepID=A0A1Z4VU68_9GAMM|nr:alpha/beta hydrolase [Thiohalobacter thiocyanaticus]BAZ95186.1 alpha/beta hydrolase fold protein [Thiohalobacter thiocyanaticus]